MIKKAPITQEYLAMQLDYLKQQRQGKMTMMQMYTEYLKFGNDKSGADNFRKSMAGLAEYLDNGWDLIPPKDTDNKEGFSLNRDGTAHSCRIIELPEGSDTTPEEIMRLHGLDCTKWVIINYTNNYWDAQQREGRIVTLYQSKVSVRPYKDGEVSLSAIIEAFGKYEPKPIDYINKIANYGEGNKVEVLPIVDLHYNLLSTEFITGNEYNCQIAKDGFLSVVQDVYDRIKGIGVKKIIFPVGNDLFNANGIVGTTFKGTQQTNEKHIFEIEDRQVSYSSYKKLMIFLIFLKSF
jgi:hypothetical protein